MRSRLIELRERRARLIERAASERAALGEWVARAEVIEGWAAKGAAAARWLRERPLLVAACAALVLALRPRRALRWLSKGLTLWQVWREARALWQRLAPLAGPARRAS
jgi:hypothetical protein